MRAVAAEWTKLRTVHSTYLMIGTAAVLTLAIGLSETGSVAAHWATTGPADRAGFDAVGVSLDGLTYAQLAFGVLGALVAEYATGMIRTTFAAVPRRGVVFAAKAVVVGGVTLGCGEALAFGAFWSGQRQLAAAHLDVALGAPGVLRAVTSAGLYIGVVGLVGLGVGALVRHSAAGVATLFGIIFLSWPVARALEGWSYLPSRWQLSNAAFVVGQVHASAPRPRLPSLGGAYLALALYVVLALVLGAWRTTRDS